MTHLKKLDQQNIWHPFTSLMDAPVPELIEKAKGVYLQTAEGRQILDAISSWWVNIHGHGNETIAKAVYEQALELEHVIFAGFTHEPAIRLSQKILSVLPDHQSKVFFSDDGSTSVEVGLKLAIQSWYNQGIQRTKIVAIEGAYHGDTFGSMSAGDRSLFTKPYLPFLFDVEFIPFPNEHNSDDILRQFKTIVSKEDVAAFIFEPLVQGAAGMRMYSPTILDELIRLAHDNEVICIADEVMTGFGRTGKMFASDYLSNKPDIFCLSKGITGGTFPLGLTTCSSTIEKAFHTRDFTRTFFHGHSYTANPTICAAANASFELLLSQECQSDILRITERHGNFIEEIKGHSKLSDARCLGTIAAIEINSGETSYFSEIRKEIYPYFLERNLLLRPLGNVIYILPPYIISNEQLDIVYKNIKEFLDEF